MLFGGSMDFVLENKEYAFKSLRAESLWPEPHMHSHMEIVFIRKSGKSKAFADGKSVFLEQNDLFIAFPNQIHYYEDIITSSEVDILIISPDMCPEFKKVFDKHIPEIPIVKNAGANPRICASLELLMDCSEQMVEYSETLARGALLILLSEIFKVIKLENTTSHSSDVLKEILNYCYENYTNDISLQKIADDLHLGKYYISRIFNNRLRIGFNAYINSLRIRKACEILKSGDKTITETAFAVGYNSVRSFNRCFKDVRGTSPRKYQLESLSKKNYNEKF